MPVASTPPPTAIIPMPIAPLSSALSRCDASERCDGSVSPGSQPFAHWKEALDRERITYSLIQTPEEAARDPQLRAPEHQGLVKALEERWEGRLALARVG